MRTERVASCNGGWVVVVSNPRVPQLAGLDTCAAGDFMSDPPAQQKTPARNNLLGAVNAAAQPLGRRARPRPWTSPPRAHLRCRR
jgi:hypothetical protein